jgi:hypothetical protein
MASSLPKRTHPGSTSDISYGAQGPIISLSAIMGITIGLREAEAQL